MTPVLAALAPDILIGALGTEFEWYDAARPVALAGPERWAGVGWRPSAILEALSDLPLELHDPKFLTPYKISFELQAPLTAAAIDSRLTQRGLKAQALITEQTKLDIVPVGAGKHSAVSFLAQALGIAPDCVVVAGDSENDLDMFTAPFKGIVVGNARPALKALRGSHVYQARAAYAAGVAEGLRHWGLLAVKDTP